MEYGGREARGGRDYVSTRRSGLCLFLACPPVAPCWLPPYMCGPPQVGELSKGQDKQATLLTLEEQGSARLL